VILIVGQAPSRSSDSPLAFSGGPNQRKLEELLGLSAGELHLRFRCVNLLSSWPGWRGGDGGSLPSRGLYGWYDGRGRIVVDVKRARAPTKKPGFSWTYPGYKADLTPLGVAAHEAGHHVYSQMYRRIDKRAWRDVLKREAPCTRYEPNMSEAFAEAFKLFLTNPDLLRVGRPLRWEFFTKRLKLKPVRDLSWRAVLRRAHPKFIAAAESWIARGR